MNARENARDTMPKNNSLLSSGASLHWRDLTVTVPLERRARREADIEKGRTSTKVILDHVSGYVQPGQVLFIMGPSGSGKSTILDALADRVKGPVEGVQFLDGQRKSSRTLKSVAKYVQQTDDLMGVLTVKETLEVAANLYISDASARDAAVLDVMEILGLTAHAHTKIGNAFVRGLSGGQIRRVSIGCELVAAPRLLFLDEPLSGLDAASAHNVMGELRRVAKMTSMSMILTVHQPSELVFEMADTLLLIADGKTCYFGNASQAADHFLSLGFERPPRSSDIEWMLHLINRDFGRHEIVDRCIESWPASPAATELDTALDVLGVPQTSEGDKSAKVSANGSRYAVGLLQQTLVLTRRGVCNTIRNPAVLWLRFAMYLMLSLMIGLVWLRLGTSASQIYNTNNALFYVCAFMIFMSVSVLPAYLEERSVLMRERANGAYSVAAYILSHTLYEIPYVLILAIMASCVTYWLVGLTPKADRFFIFVANLFTSLFVAESMMVLFSAMIPILIVGIAAGAMTFGLFMCVQGAFISVEEIGWWLRWVKFVALHYYSYSTFLVNQYRGVTYSAAPENAFPPYPEDVLGDTIYKQFGLEERLWVNFVAQIVMIIFYRTAAAFWLQAFVKGKK